MDFHSNSKFVKIQTLQRIIGEYLGLSEKSPIIIDVFA